MAILIGVDEAGYGPNYGPLCVAATAWRVSEDGSLATGGGQVGRTARTASQTAVMRTSAASPSAATEACDLYVVLNRAVVRSPAQCTRRIAIADSKTLYQSGTGLRQLERGVLAALGTLRRDVTNLNDLLDATNADPLHRRHETPCHATDADRLPIEVSADDLTAATALLDVACGQRGVALLTLQARLVYPAEFNDLCEVLGTKGAALSHVTLGLVRQVVDSLSVLHGSQPMTIFLDKHGGRGRYAALLQNFFPESWIDTIAEGRAESRYRWECVGCPIEATFRVGCEEVLPTALASMTAKYHRELAMRAFNAYWTERVSGLRPTAGYPRDAQRFRAEIAAAQAKLGICDRVLWRIR